MSTATTLARGRETSGEILLSTGPKIRGIIATDRPGRDGLTLDLDNARFRKTPLPLLVAHDLKALPIGHVTDLHTERRDGYTCLIGTLVFGGSKRAKEIERDVRTGLVSELSIGFDVEKGARDYRTGRAIPTITEVSLVPIAADTATVVFERAYKPAARHDERVDMVVADMIAARDRHAIGSTAWVTLDEAAQAVEMCGGDPDALRSKANDLDADANRLERHPDRVTATGRSTEGNNRQAARRCRTVAAELRAAAHRISGRKPIKVDGSAANEVLAVLDEGVMSMRIYSSGRRRAWWGARNIPTEAPPPKPVLRDARGDEILVPDGGYWRAPLPEPDPVKVLLRGHRVDGDRRYRLPAMWNPFTEPLATPPSNPLFDRPVSWSTVRRLDRLRVRAARAEDERVWRRRRAEIAVGEYAEAAESRARVNALLHSLADPWPMDPPEVLTVVPGFGRPSGS